MKAPGLHDPFPARPDDPDERLAITQSGGSRLRLGAYVLPELYNALYAYLVATPDSVEAHAERMEFGLFTGVLE